MKTFRLFAFVVSFAMLTSCENELPMEFGQPIDLGEAIEPNEEFVINEGLIQLGEKLENPYSLTNMQKAFEMLPPDSRSGYTADDIKPTHLYVKFKPANVDELDALFWSNDDLDFYSYPLDYERGAGNYYRDPSLPENVPTYYYASIPIERQIPEECEYEILEELYIPDELSDYTRTLAPSFINAIVEKSFELTNNDYEGDAVATRSDGQTRASYTYSGRVRVYDHLTNGYVPVAGAVVRCNRWFTTVKATTNSSGYYTIFRESTNKYKYSILWECDNLYDIRDGEFDQAILQGPEQVAGWSVDIATTAPNVINYATINRAAYRYFHGNTGGLHKATPMNWGDLKICYIRSSGENGEHGYFNDEETLEVGGNIFIYQKNDSGENFATNYIFSTAVHEMAHSTHAVAMTCSEFRNVEAILKESWAVFAQSLLFYLEFGELGLYDMQSWSYEYVMNNKLYDYEVNLRPIFNWPAASGHLEYSCLFIDMYDDYNQRVESGFVNRPNDVITGYSPEVLNSIVVMCYGIEDLRYYLSCYKPTNVTDAMIDDYIDAVSEIYY